MTTRQMLLGRGGRIPSARRSLLGGAVAAVSVLALSSGANAVPSQAASPPPKTILTFQTMVANAGPYVGTAGTLRRIPAGPEPWSILSAQGSLTTSGHLSVVVHGLVVAGSNNPVPDFEGAVSCQSIDTRGKASVVNVFTKPFPATTSGDSVISATVKLPKPCFAPLIFVTSPAPQSWFAVTGM
jgi:hypothetical protein